MKANPGRLAAPPSTSSAPLVSIVTPSFNQGRFLRRTIDSVLAQDYPRIEYLVIDGGSTDESIAILRDYGDRFSWISEPDRGQAHAINKGLGRARGELLAYLNSDDELAPGAVTRVVQAFADNPAAHVVYGEAFITDEQDRIVGRYPTEDFDRDRLLEACFLCQPATFWRAAATRECGLFDEGLAYAMDYDYWLRLAQAGAGFCRVNEVLACTRAHAATKTLACREEVLREILAVCSRHGGRGAGPYRAYWHYRCREQPTGWARRVAFLERLLAAAHRLRDRAGRRLARTLGRGGRKTTCIDQGASDAAGRR